MAASSLDSSNSAPPKTETELLAALAQEVPNLANLGLLLARYRSEANMVIMDNLQLAHEHDAEQTLWTRHVEVCSLFKKALRVLAKEGKNVEYRKTTKIYRDFLNGAMLHYRGFIQGLVTKYGRMPELDQVAAILGSKTSTVTSSEDTRYMALLSCHQTLIFLGDLSRYREEARRKEVRPKDPNWAQAIGYYGLAQVLYPNSGTPQHQLAIVARNIGSHFQVTYHLYRSVAVKEPDPRARSSLELEMKKITAAHEKGELFDTSEFITDARGRLPVIRSVPLLMLLHSRLYKCDSMAGDEQLENEALVQLSIDMEEHDFDHILQKIALTNIAAQHFAGVRFQSPPNSAKDMNAVVCFLRLNIKTFITLLEVLRQELTLPETGFDDVHDYNNEKLPDGLRKLSALMRCIIPTLRHYSSWLRSDIKFIAGCLHDPVVKNLLKGFFKMYLNTMTLLASLYPRDRMASMDYLLPEDEDTIAFKPFDGATSRYFDQNSLLKPKFHSPGVEREHPTLEMLGRIYNLLEDAAAIAMRNDIPFQWDEMIAAFEEPSMPDVLPERLEPNISDAECQPAPVNKKLKFDAIAFLEGHISDHMSKTSSSSVSVVDDTAMKDMVNNLVDHSDPLPKGSPVPDHGPIGTPPRRSSGRNSSTNTPPKVTGNETSYGVIGTPTAQELARKLSPYSSMETSPRPRLPSAFRSHFAPEADESASYQNTGSAKAGFPSQDLPKNLQPAFSNNGHVTQSVNSSMSSLQASRIGMPQQRIAGMMCTHSPRNQPNIWHHERHASAANMYTSSQFMSSNILSGSTYNGSRPEATYQTPPNGQGHHG